MTYYDVFNGDADGICALTQLRNAQPRESQLITGVKRDIKLLTQVKAQAGDHVTVLDVSLDSNRDGLEKVLAAGADVFYCDHHFAGEIPESTRLKALINTASDICTSLLINKYLQGQFALWAIVGAFGDNLKKSAMSVAKSQDLTAAQLEQLENLGIYINYNGYGAAIEDLHFPPAELFQLVSPFASPLDFISEGKVHFDRLEQGYHADMGSAAETAAAYADSSAAVFVLPDAPWARRVSGVYSNDLANSSPDRAHAVVTEKADGNYLISVRAPLNNKTGADELCLQFPSGGGRAAAAGINDLPADGLDDFISRFAAHYAR